MSDLNLVMIRGRMGRDPEVRTFQSGDKVANLSIATSKYWKDRQTGEQREKTEWHRVSVYGDGPVRLCEQYLRKGAGVAIHGALETRKWQDRSGADRYSTEIVVRGYEARVDIIDWPDRGDRGGSGGSGGGGGYGDSDPSPGGQGDPDPGQGGGGPGGFDDEIPFAPQFL